MTQPPHDNRHPNDETQWSWDNVPQVSGPPPVAGPPATEPPAGEQDPYGHKRFGEGASPTGYEPIQLRPTYLEAQPGIIPLRPLKLGEFFDGGFRAIRFNPGVMLGVAAIVIFGSLILELLVVNPVLTRIEAFNPANPDGFVVTDRDVVTLLASTAGPAVLSFIASTVLTGLLIQCVTQSILGKRVTLAQVWEQAKGRILPLIGLTILITLAGVIYFIAVFALLAFASFFVFSSLSTETSSAFGFVIVGFLLVTALAVGWLAFLVKTSLATPALMAERVGVFQSVKRSFSLTKGLFWRIAGVLFLTVFLLAAMSAIVTGLITTLITAVIGGSGAATDLMSLTSMSTIASSIIGSLVQLVFTPFLAAVVTLVYTDTRMRKEGLDLLLQRAAAENPAT